MSEHYIDERVREMPCPNKCDQASDHTSEPHPDCEDCHGRGVIAYRECETCIGEHTTDYFRCGRCTDGRIIVDAVLEILLMESGGPERPEWNSGLEEYEGWWWAEIMADGESARNPTGPYDTADEALAAARKALA